MRKPVKRGDKWLAEWRIGVGRNAPRRSQTFATKGEATRFLHDVQARQARDGWVDPRAVEVVTMAELLSAYGARPELAPGTATLYGNVARHVDPILGDLSVSKVRREHVLQAGDVMRASGLAPSTVRTYLGIVAGVLGKAQRDGLRPDNPARGAAGKPPARREVRVLTVEQVGRLLDAATTFERRLMVMVAVGSGLRQGELLGLRTPRVDFLRRQVSVEEQATTGASGPPTLTPRLKTAASRRRVPVPDEITQGLARLLEDGPRDLLFPAPSGLPWRRGSFNESVWKPTLRRAELPMDLGWHVLRHTYASHLIAAGLHPRVIQARLGHASIVETMDTYGHLFEDGDDQTRTAVSTLFTAPVAGKATEA